MKITNFSLPELVATHLAFPFSPLKAREHLHEGHLKTQPWEKELETAAKFKIKIIPFTDPLYPAGSKQLPDAPLLLYSKGDLLPQDEESVSIVGTRAASPYGLLMAEQFAKEIAAYGLCIVSGLARGIDTAAHRGALSRGRTLAVIGSGLLSLYPKENEALAETIGRQGCVLSEYPLYTPPDKFQFPKRNRLIAALSLGSLFIEGACKSGGMITMDWAAKLKKICFTIPGRLDMESFKGNHLLLKSGKARLVENAQEMVSLLVPDRRPMENLTSPTASLNPRESVLIAQFPECEISFEELVIRTQTDAPALNALLSALLLKKTIRQLPGKLYKKV
jgi:DNA processing protein